MSATARNLWISIGLFILVVILVYVVAREYNRTRTISLEIQKLQTEYEEVTHANNMLERSLDAMNSDAFSDRSAKENLQMLRDDEFVVGFAPTEEGNDEELLQESVDLPIWKQWLHLFTGAKNTS